MANLIAGIGRARAGPEDVIVVLDGDDWLHGDTALDTIAATLSPARLLDDLRELRFPTTRRTRDSSGACGRPTTTTRVDFRHAEWRHTAVRTWKRWLLGSRRRS